MDNILIFSTIFLMVGLSITLLLLVFKKDNNNNNQVVDLLKQDNEKLKDENVAIRAELIEAKTRLSANLDQMNDWEKTKQQFIEQAKSSSVQVSQNLVSDLLQKHNKQAEAQRQETEKSIAENTKKLYESYQTLFSSVDILKHSLEKNSTTIGTIKTALSSSSDVGYASEAILENILISFGLSPEIDFLTQVDTETESGKLRPDGIIFLPNNSAMVIDSKASKFVFELAEAEYSGDTDKIEIANKNLKSSMKQHLKNLKTKDYKTALQKLLNQNGKQTSLNEITFVMWLKNDAIVEKVQKAHPLIMQEASDNNIFICGPTALWCAIGIASQKINIAKQSKNNHKIREEVEKLLGKIATVIERGNRVEKGLLSATKAWGDLKTSFNGKGGLLSSTNKIQEYGVQSPKSLTLLGKQDDSNILDVENSNTPSNELESPK